MGEAKADLSGNTVTQQQQLTVNPNCTRPTPCCETYVSEHTCMAIGA